MLKEEEYRKAVCGKIACTVWWGGGGNPTALLYRGCKPLFKRISEITFNLSTQPKEPKFVHGNISREYFWGKIWAQKWV